MSINLYKPHVLVVPEDDANRQLANGFLKDPALNLRVIQVLPVAGGWAKVRDDFVAVQQTLLRKYSERHLVLLVDFDDQVADRRQLFADAFPDDIQERIYLLGTQYEPESLRKSSGVPLEGIGEQLGNACAHEESGLWAHPMLQNNQSELDRLIQNVKPFLFKG